MNLKQLRFAPRLPDGQRGQAMIEYAVAAFVLAIALLTPVPGITPSQSAAQLLATKIHDLYLDITYYVSLP